MDQEHRDTNRRMWDELAPIHAASDFYDVPGFLSGMSHLRPFECEEAGGMSLAVLWFICNATLVWTHSPGHVKARIVTGLDFSEPAITAARGIAEQAGVEADFIVGDVHDAPQLLDRRFEIVYTGIGALCWLPDITAWAEVVARLVKPGGILYMPEVHPYTDMFGEEDLLVREHYFDHGVAYREESGGTYAATDVKTENNVDYSWTHSVSSVISALIKVGFVLELFSEHDYTVFRQFKALEHHPKDRTYRFPEGQSTHAAVVFDPLSDAADGGGVVSCWVSFLQRPLRHWCCRCVIEALS